MISPLIPRPISSIQLKAWLDDADSNQLLIDVREDAELLLAPFSQPVMHLPLSQRSEWEPSLRDSLSAHKTIVVICHAGIRSWNFGTWILSQGWGHEVWNLEGGIDSWSIQVDPLVPRY